MPDTTAETEQPYGDSSGLSLPFPCQKEPGTWQNGQLPPGCEKITEQLRGNCERLEQAVLDQRGELTHHDQALVSTVWRLEGHVLLCQRWLELHEADMEHNTKLTFATSILTASKERDRLIGKLCEPKRFTGKPRPQNLSDAL